MVVTRLLERKEKRATLVEGNATAEVERQRKDVVVNRPCRGHREVYLYVPWPGCIPAAYIHPTLVPTSC